ncbi:winged helix-turn-helix domain-containing protein, partial [Desulfovibrio desulfuricans]|nr:winged helix-turn-helix domain-containing protein [Desulfovibrio desulfuricans]
YLGDDKTINVHISNIRSKLSTVSEREFIETIWGIGFKWKD